MEVGAGGFLVAIEGIAQDVLFRAGQGVEGKGRPLRHEKRSFREPRGVRRMQAVVKCTVAIPIYNRKIDVLNRVAIDSAMEQPLKDMQILVIDDCSTDGTWELLQQVRDPRLSLVRNEHNLGLFGNFNRCLELAEGEYVRLLCSDDRLAPDCLGREVALLDRYPDVGLLLTRGRRVDGKGQVLGRQADHFQEGIYSGPAAIRSALWFHSHYALNPFNYPSGMLLRRETALKAGRFDTAMRMSGDVDFFLRMLEHGDLAVSDRLGCEITIHGNQEGVRLAGDVAIRQRPRREVRIGNRVDDRLLLLGVQFQELGDETRLVGAQVAEVLDPDVPAEVVQPDAALAQAADDVVLAQPPAQPLE